MDRSIAALPGERTGPVKLKTLLAWLVADGIIDTADASKVSDTGRWTSDTETHPLVVIANQKLVSRLAPNPPLSLESLTAWMARKAGLPYVRIDPLKINVSSVGGLVSRSYAVRHRILPLAVDHDTVTFATAEPFLSDWMDDLRHLMRKDIRRVVANPMEIRRYLMEFHGVSQSVRQAGEAGQTGGGGVLNFEQLLELGKTGELAADDQPVVQIVDWLLQYAFEQRASDIHLEPRRDRGHVRFRIDGLLNSVYEMPPPVMAAVTSRIKILGRMDVAEKRRPQDGRIKTRSPGGREVELRLSTMATAFGEKCVMRIFDPEVVVKPYQELGFSSDESSRWRTMVERSHGIVLVTGPTGSGKTTTLYSTLRALARPEINVCTVEDPIEMVMPELNQMQVQPSIGLNFAQGIRTLMRQDPDIIMVGEIRDLETAQMAIQASLTGHLVFSTLHTNDAPSAISRLADIGVAHYLIQSTLVGVVAQRLVRTICPHCKTEGDLSAPHWESLTHPWAMDEPARVMRGAGCDECRKTGYLGRIAIFEMLNVTGGVRSLMGAAPDTDGLRRQAVRDGMRPLRLSAAALVAQGLTTVDEALRVVPPTED